MRIFDVREFGAVGDGKTLDTAAIQKAVDAAAAHAAGGSKAQVLVRGGKRYLIGTVVLKSGIDFHLADDAELLLSLNPGDYLPGDWGEGGGAALVGEGAHGLSITGTGSINGRSPEVMTQYDAKDEWWFPIPKWRPKLVVLTACNDLEIRDVLMKQASVWTLHMIGCERVLVDGVKIRNQLDVPNCDGIDPDHCKHVEIRNCDIVCGDDAIVLKATRAGKQYGGCSNIVVKDCVLETQDSGIKIGTETTADIHDVVFERIEMRRGCRGLTIQLRDEGSVSRIKFRDIKFTSQYFSDPWWGRGEAISFTAMPRIPIEQGGKVGVIHSIQVENVTARAENSVRVAGAAGGSRVRDVVFSNVSLELDRWTKYRGGIFDNRPTKSQEELPARRTSGFSIEHADNVLLKDCRVMSGKARPEYFAHAIEARDVTGLIRDLPARRRIRGETRRL